jgi:RNA polymerase sigma factor (sigma-70 family)
MTAAFAELYAVHLTAARRVALSLVPADQADDITAEAFTRVLAAMTAGGGPAGEFRPYLLATVRHLAADWHAERACLAAVPVDLRQLAAPDAGQLATWHEQQRMTWRAFARLPARWRAVLWQTEVEGRSPAQLASASGMTPNAVSQLAVRARVGLAIAYQAERGDQMRYTGPLPVLRAMGTRRKLRQSA